MPDESNVQDEIAEEAAVVLPSREAMSIIDPSFITRMVPMPPHDTATQEAPVDGATVDPTKVTPDGDPTGGA